jgi:hypothetical protein
MKKNIMLYILILLTVTSLSYPNSNKRPWEYSKTLNEIKIFKRPGADENLYEFLATVTISRPLNSILDTIKDTPSNKYWMADCIHSELLKKTGDDEIICYYITAPPWPLDKRDTLIKIKIIKEKGQTKLLMNSLDQAESGKYKKINPEYVRIYRMEGEVSLREIDSETTEVQFSAAGEPGGIVPDFMVRLGGWIIPYKTLSGLKKYIK